MSRNTFKRLAAAGALVAMIFANAGVQSAHAATTLVACSGLSSIMSMNPTLKSTNANYVKAVSTDSNGTKLDMFGSPVPADALTCLVDSGIRTNNGLQDARYQLDDQTGGNAVLTTSGVVARAAGSMVGSASCDLTGTADNLYPVAYPFQGKVAWRFDQLDGSSRQVQSQQYVKLSPDPDIPLQFKVTGTVIKGPGVGGDVTAELGYVPTSNVKNLNFSDCFTGGTGASIAEVSLSQKDGSDADTLIDPWVITLPT